MRVVDLLISSIHASGKELAPRRPILVKDVWSRLSDIDVLIVP